MRGTFGVHLAKIAAEFKLDIEDRLAEILPARLIAIRTMTTAVLPKAKVKTTRPQGVGREHFAVPIHQPQISLTLFPAHL
jgi:hypothetical protein